MTDLPEGFQFSQGSLQDFADCRRRFRLRYLDRLAWPAMEAEPADEYEALVTEGEAFHRLLERAQAGVDPAHLAGEAQEEGSQLEDWWGNYLAAPPQGLPANRYAEVSLSAPLGSYRLVAQYDLIAVEPGVRAVIVDWKTSQKRTASATLAARMQTRVYRYLLTRAGAALNGGLPIRPEQVEMIYWFANFPDEPETLRYDTALFHADEVLFNTLVAQIEQEDADGFPLTADERHCRYCSYRSLCDRGVEGGTLAVLDDPEVAVSAGQAAPEFDFDQIAAIEF